jgi:S1/P1 Nuclease
MMKKKLNAIFAVALAFILSSWGGAGHKTVATIAENHLTSEAKSSIKNLLGDQSIADIASWADEVRNQPEYKQTGPWHYVDLPLGYSYEQFATEVKKQGADNVYGAMLHCEEQLKSNLTPNEQKAIALKFLVHFVGDSHQPMHVSRAEDKGGNSIQVQFNGKGSNLHSLWDSGLINREGKTFDQMAKDYDTATPAEIQKWQSDSYQASTKIYSDVEKNNTLDDEYYKANIPVIQQRIEMGGIRLAGELNKIFAAYPVKGMVTHIGTPMSANVAKTIDIKDAASHLNEWVSITAQAYSSRNIGEMTLVNLGAAYPNQ